MKVMKKILKSKVFIFVVTAITFSSISVYAAGRYYATRVVYEPSNPNFNVDNMSDALDQLYTTQNSTVNNLNSQVSAKDATISSLQSQVESLTAAASEKDYVTGTFTFPKTGNKDCNLGFRPSKVFLYYTSSSMSVFIYYSGSYNYWTAVVGSSGWNDYNHGGFEVTSTGFRIKYVETSWSESNKTFNYVAFK